MNHPKHQHWVPQFYLRQFATPDTRSEETAQVWIFSKEEADGDERLTNVRNVCGKRYLYSPKDKNGERDWHLEHKLAGLESAIGMVWPKLANEFPDINDSVIRKGVSLFVAVLHLRNPEMRQTVESIHQRLVGAYESAPTEPEGIPAIDAITIQGVTHKDDPSGWQEYRTWGKNDHDRFFINTVEAVAMQIAECLLKKRWSVIFSETDVFITSDKPVVLHHESRDTFGFGTQGSIVTFPLSPTRLLVMDDMHTEPGSQYYPLVHANLGAFNRNIWENGSRFMITGRPVPEVLTEILAWVEAQED